MIIIQIKIIKHLKGFFKISNYFFNILVITNQNHYSVNNLVIVIFFITILFIFHFMINLKTIMVNIKVFFSFYRKFLNIL